MVTSHGYLMVIYVVVPIFSNLWFSLHNHFFSVEIILILEWGSEGFAKTPFY